MNRCLAIFLLALPSLCGLLSVITTFAATSPALEPDDVRYFSQLWEFLSDPVSHWKNAFIIRNSWEDQWWVASGYVSYVRPIPILSYLVNMLFFGRSAYVLLYTNVLLFLGLCFSVTLLLRAITKNSVAATLGACWFATLPIHSEGVAYIAGRTDVLAWTFGALYLRSHILGRPLFHKLLLYFLALMCKEYCLLLPIVCFLFDREPLCNLSFTRLKSYLPFVVLSVLYLLAHRALLEGGSLRGAPLPLYFPVSSVEGGVYHLTLQTLYLISLAVVGLCGAMYATAISIDLAVFSAVSLPFFVAILLGGRKGSFWGAALLFLLVTLAVTAPLYVSLRYLIGPSIALACCVSLAYEGISRRGMQVVFLLCVIPVVTLHSIILASTIEAQLAADTRSFYSVASLVDAIEERKDDLRSCDVGLVVNAPPEQVFQMFMGEFFKVGLQKPHMKTVVLSHCLRKQAGEPAPKWSRSTSGSGIEVHGAVELVTEDSSDMSLPLWGSPISVSTSANVQISVDSTWKGLSVEWPSSMSQRVCVVEFQYKTNVSLTATPVA